MCQKMMMMTISNKSNAIRLINSIKLMKVA